MIIYSFEHFVEKLLLPHLYRHVIKPLLKCLYLVSAVKTLYNKPFFFIEAYPEVGLVFNLLQFSKEKSSTLSPAIADE